MTPEQITAAIFIIIAICGVASIVIGCACALSSQISREEEAKGYYVEQPYRKGW